jgi:hypothetical protein
LIEITREGAALGGVPHCGAVKGAEEELIRGGRTLEGIEPVFDTVQCSPVLEVIIDNNGIDPFVDIPGAP